MAEFLSDEVSELRQRAYWELFREGATIAEWEYACLQAMNRATYHKVPLPHTLWEYIREYRQQHKTQADKDALPLATVTQIEAYRARQALEGTPEWRRAQIERLERERADQKAHEQWRDEQSYQTLLEMGLINPPDPRRWLPLTDDMGEETQEPRPYTGKSGLRRLMDASNNPHG